ncbi:permease-like cell division protein FtsX [Luteipulveratus flavus]|uniref:Cell division protein FtsX n=1 Tax=Luteipulveratus flavus TaxID=3031728 RepID=A0ABT6C405_9MICO|nr:permease-like cell division protein FtsX [Luteipulveratus sp. YIM 133296]MDF8263688.1 permease-like cell division protein FtsX [Luteipulveratus sp. YIM 133296]
MRLQFMLSEIVHGLRRNVAMVVSVVLVSMVSLFFLGSGLLAHRQVDTAKGYWYDKVQVSIFLCTAQSTDAPSCADGAVSAGQRDQIRSDLASLEPLVDRIYYESSDQAYTRFQDQFRNSPYLGSVDRAAMPESFRVKLSDPTRFGEIVSAFDGAPGVEAVSDQRKVLDTFFNLLNVLSIGSVALAVVMLVCSILLITTTIRQVAFSRRRQVGIMRLVGASATVIHLPFVVETVIATMIGAVLAIGLLWAMVHYGVSGLLENGSGGGGLISLVGEADVWAIAPWLLVGAFVLAVVTSFVTLRRYLRV